MQIDARVLVKGGGDLATGAAYRLCRAGFGVIVTEIPQPTVVRRSVAFAEAVYAGDIVIEGVRARLASSVAQACELIAQRIVAVLVDPSTQALHELRPEALVDGIMAKVNTGTALADAGVVVGLGPGFDAGIDCHAVIETNRGHHLGRVITHGAATPNTGVPGAVGGETARRILRAPVAGRLQAVRQIGDYVREGDVVASVGGAPIASQIDGVLRGLLHDGLPVTLDMKVGDVDPRAEREHCFTISDKSLAVGGGALEAVMMLLPAATPRG